MWRSKQFVHAQRVRKCWKPDRTQSAKWTTEGTANRFCAVSRDVGRALCVGNMLVFRKVYGVLSVKQGGTATIQQVRP